MVSKSKLSQKSRVERFAKKMNKLSPPPLPKKKNKNKNKTKQNNLERLER